jgi:hypothetical protein
MFEKQRGQEALFYFYTMKNTKVYNFQVGKLYD